MNRIYSLAHKTLIFAYFVLVFITPMLVVPYTSELFEFNKMFTVYTVTVIVLIAWLVKGISKGKIQLARSHLDIPIVLFLGALTISYFLSIDQHISLWGYYSRQHGGLLSVISFILLFYAFISNVKKEEKIKLLYLSLFSGLLVSAYGILQHFGVDKHLWVQDVARRVFSSLGQPNWLAAYLDIMLFISLGLGISRHSNSKLKVIFYTYILPGIFLLTVLYTKSRSGLVGFVIADFVYWILILKSGGIAKFKNTIIGFHILILAIAFVTGLSDTPLHRFTLPSIINKYKQSQIDETIIRHSSETVLSLGGSQSGEIRKLVWQAAISAGKDHPLFGTGVETFAWTFYKYKPVEHNLTSEWDFLYNKAHNEYLNFFATTGYIGLGAYLLFIARFILFAFRSMFKDSLQVGLFAAWVSVLVTNFFGFSVVVISIFFWLIPASFFGTHSGNVVHIPGMGLWVRKVLVIAIILSGGLFLTVLGRYWNADVLYAQGEDLINNGYSLEGRRKLAIAVKLRPSEPNYWSELAYANGLQALASYQRQESSRSAELIFEAIAFQKIARSMSPNNLNLAKDSVRLYYLLSEADPKLLSIAISQIKDAQKLAPNDPKLLYNLALLYSSDKKQSELVIPTLKKALELKSDYRDARLLLGLFLIQDNENKLAKDQFEYILKNINSKDEEAINYLEGMK